MENILESAGKRKKHILMIVENSAAPGDPRVWKEAKTLLNNNYEVTIICPKYITYNDT